jgi:hypothetical protein
MMCIEMMLFFEIAGICPVSQNTRGAEILPLNRLSFQKTAKVEGVLERPFPLPLFP